MPICSIPAALQKLMETSLEKNGVAPWKVRRILCRVVWPYHLQKKQRMERIMHEPVSHPYLPTSYSIGNQHEKKESRSHIWFDLQSKSTWPRTQLPLASRWRRTRLQAVAQTIHKLQLKALKVVMANMHSHQSMLPQTFAAGHLEKTHADEVLKRECPPVHLINQQKCIHA